ncbi:MAG TPA: hypothetical protein VFV38_21320 [Ktedonobacteraceae bacterium]|nr:hypothetical protein [Ktedonobacteraceae bacterium]
MKEHPDKEPLWPRIQEENSNGRRFLATWLAKRFVISQPLVVSLAASIRSRSGWLSVSRRSLLLYGGMERPDWVRNAWRQPNVTVTITDMVFAGYACPVNNSEEDALVRRLIGKKYRESEQVAASYIEGF